MIKASKDSFVIPKEELKDFYLKFAFLLNPDSCSINRTEFELLNILLKDLKKQGIWVFGTAANGTTGLYDADLKGPAAIVIGSEGDGMTRLAAENCDFLVSIPMKGDLNSLNASASAAILLYEAVRQRMN